MAQRCSVEVDYIVGDSIIREIEQESKTQLKGGNTHRDNL